MTNQNNTTDKSLLNMEILVNKLRSKDTENMKLTRSMIIMYSIIVLLQLFVYVIFPDPEYAFTKRIGGICLVVGFGIFLWYFRYFYLKYKHVNYADSIKNVLEAAEKRYRFWHVSYFAIFFAVILVSVGLSFVLNERFLEGWSTAIIISIVSLVTISAFLFGFFVGYQKWKKEQRPLQQAAKRLLEEIER